MIKTLKLSMILCLLAISMSYLSATSTHYLWPIKGQKAGKDIIHAPQGYIDGEHNFSDVFITAAKGTELVSPVDGKITHVGIGYRSSLTYSHGWPLKEEESFDEAWERIQTDLKPPFKAQYLSGGISIQTEDGYVIHLAGLRGDRKFNTGQKVKKGEVLGTVWYSYPKIKEPSIDLSISYRTKPSDPMTPFGIRSSYIPPKEIKPIKTLSQAQAKEDILVLIETLKEAYPTLYRLISKEDLGPYVDSIVSKIETYGDSISFGSLQRIVMEVIEVIHDSHIYLHEPAWKPSSACAPPEIKRQPKVLIGWFRDTLFCSNAVKEYEDLIGKPIRMINGISSDSARTIVRRSVSNYDANVQGYKDNREAMLGFGMLFKGQNFSMDLEFMDGQKLKIPSHDVKKHGWPQWIHDIGPFMRLNYREAGYHCSMLNDSVAYIQLSTFSLSEVDVQKIGAFMDSIKRVPYLIMDVRNNGGGHEEVLEKLYTYIAGEPFEVVGYSRVNNREGFKSFQYAMNFAPNDTLFGHYQAVDGMEGFFENPPTPRRITADSLINYKGKIYMLVNENSVSAATLMPAMLIRNHRGVVVGRESRTAYHYMTALKFADIRLPNSTLTVTIPLVELVFDTVVNERVPFGRGVLPDYPLALTMEETLSTHGDAILNYALSLIEQGKYISDVNPFAIEPHSKKKRNRWIVFFTIAIALSIAVSQGRKHIKARETTPPKLDQ